MNLADLSIRRPVFATILIAAIMIFGLISYPKVGVDLYPEVDFPVVTTTVIYPGADPETLSNDVADPIEEVINSMGGLKAVRSTNVEGVSLIVAEFELEVEADQAVQDLRDRISRVQSQLPDGAEAPIIEKFDIGAAPIMTLALSGDMSPRELTDIADDIVKERIQRIAGVGGVDIVGGQERQVQVLVDPIALRGEKLAIDDVVRAIGSQSIEIPAGNVVAHDRDLAVRTNGEAKTLDDIRAILIPGANGRNLRVDQVATVVDSVKDVRSAAAWNGKSTVTLIVRKQSGANTVTAAHEVGESLADLGEVLKSRGATLEVATDNSIYIARSIEEVEFDLVFGGVLAIVVIFFFLIDWRATLISALAIPTSVVGTFAFIQVMGFTFNNMTMLALSLAIGILIDDAIVVIENIHRHLELGKTPMQAASDATKEIFLAVLAMTSTIVAVFVPVAIMKGIVGRFFLQFGLTVSFAVGLSMLVSFTLTPMLASRLLKHSHGAKKGFFARMVDWLVGGLERGYGAIIRTALRFRWSTVLASVVTLMLSGVMVSQVKTEFSPAEDRGEFLIEVEMPQGTPLEETNRMVQFVADDMRKSGPHVTDTLATVGEGTSGQVNKGVIRVKLKGSKSRPHKQVDIMAWVRDRYASLNPARVTVLEADGVGGGGQPIQYNIRGTNREELIAAANALKDKIAERPGFTDVAISYRGGKPELVLEVARARAADLNVPVSSVASTVRMLMAEDRVGELTEGTENTDITVRLPPEYRARIESLPYVQVRAQDGKLVDISAVVDAKEREGASQIDREARQVQVTVTAGLTDGLIISDAIKLVEEDAAQVVPKHLTTAFGGGAEIMEESFGYMFEALAIAILLVYMILALQFNSFVQPLTIMVSLPFSVIGAFGGLYLSGMTLSIFSMIGFILLMGLVTKNAILLVDFANQLRAEGAAVNAALVKSGVLRLRPIIMTTFAIVFGMMPVALALGEGGETRAPMAVCVIGGMLTSTVLTLVVVPVVYSLVEGAKDSRLIRWIMPAGKPADQELADTTHGSAAHGGPAHGGV